MHFFAQIPPRRGARLLRVSLGALTLISACCGTAPAVRTDLAVPPDARLIPTRFEANRFFATPELATGGSLELLLDTGGNEVLYASAVTRLGLAPEEVTWPSGETATLVAPPGFREDAGIPPLSNRGGRLLVHADDPGRPSAARDGMLGPGFFGHRAWLFDYPAQRLYLLGEVAPPADAVVFPLGLRPDTQFPRVRVTVAGEEIDLLFDTGAHTPLTAEARRVIGGPPVQATGFICDEIFQRWRTDHPDWRVIEGGDGLLGGPLIEVPHVELGGLDLGPAWFAHRKDASFHDFMSRWMDQPIHGALGGDALRDLRVWLDYPNARAWLAR